MDEPQKLYYRDGLRAHGEDRGKGMIIRHVIISLVGIRMRVIVLMIVIYRRKEGIGMGQRITMYNPNGKRVQEEFELAVKLDKIWNHAK